MRNGWIDGEIAYLFHLCCSCKERKRVVTNWYWQWMDREWREKEEVKRDKTTYTHTHSTHTHPRRSELPPTTWWPRIFFLNFRSPGSREEIINRICMSVCMMYGLNSPKNKIKIKRRGKKAWRKTEETRQDSNSPFTSREHQRMSVNWEQSNISE